MSELFDPVLARGEVPEQLSDRAWLQAMLDFEAGLARALAAAGLLPAEHAEQIAAACHADRFDAAEIGAQAAGSGNPAAPLASALRTAVEGPAADQVHRGATSQDVLDTAAMLVAKRALAPLLADLAGAADAAAVLAEADRNTPMAGRTLMLQAVPTTFGLKAAGWLVALDEASARLEQVRDTRLAVQLGGAAGTLASLGTDGVDVVGALARDLGL
ncbi:MAG: lyase family protein, partial [Solirubrobacteraceae bacterium]